MHRPIQGRPEPQRLRGSPAPITAPLREPLTTNKASSASAGERRAPPLLHPGPPRLRGSPSLVPAQGDLMTKPWPPAQPLCLSWTRHRARIIFRFSFRPAAFQLVVRCVFAPLFATKACLLASMPGDWCRPGGAPRLKAGGILPGNCCRDVYTGSPDRAPLRT